MTPRIEFLLPKKIVGLHITMSMQTNKTTDLWRLFMSRRIEVKHRVNSDLISLQLYPKAYFENYNPSVLYEKWATVEVSNFNEVPPNMDTLILEEGLYAVFIYKKSESDAETFFTNIFSDWLPNSDYSLDKRPHFEILGDKYKYNDPNSEEEVWIPVKLR